MKKINLLLAFVLTSGLATAQHVTEIGSSSSAHETELRIWGLADNTNKIGGKILFRNTHDGTGEYPAAKIQWIRDQHSWGTSLSFHSYNGISLIKALTIDSQQRIGIGTTTPDYSLHVKKVSGDSEVRTESYDHFAKLGTNFSGGYLGASNGNGETTINIRGYGDTYFNAGNVGIGTETPTGKLDVNGDIALKYGSAIKVNEVNTGSWTSNSNRTILKTGWNETVFDYVDFKVPGSTPNTANIRFTRSGYVGIGTMTPGYSLHIKKASGNSEVRTESYDHFAKLGTNSSGGYLGASNDSGETTINIRGYGDSYFNAGNVGIGTTTPKDKLSVNGRIGAEEINCRSNINVYPDYVFDEDYDLPKLQDTKNYIEENHHLPEIPSAAEAAENGINLKEMNIKLLKKIEELTLHMIRIDEELQQVKSENKTLKESITSK